jgi:hypothetical protein
MGRQKKPLWRNESRKGGAGGLKAGWAAGERGAVAVIER